MRGASAIVGSVVVRQRPTTRLLTTLLATCMRDRHLQAGCQGSVPDGVGSFHRKSADADAVVGEDHDCSCFEIVDEFRKVRQKRGSLKLRTPVALTEKDQTRQCQRLSDQQLTEVSICRDEDPPVLASSRENLIVAVARQSARRYVDDLVAGTDQDGSQTGADALVEHEPHAGVRSGTCRSLTAAAANERAARTSSTTSCG